MAITPETTAEQLAQIAAEGRPNVCYRAAKDGNSVAAWTDGRWVPVAGRTIPRGDWYSIELELTVNGHPAYDPGLYGQSPPDLA